MTLGTTLLSLVRLRVVAQLKRVAQLERCGCPILYLNFCFLLKKTETQEAVFFGVDIFKVVLCRVRTNHTRDVYPGYYPDTKNFCKFCRTFIPVPGTSGSSVRQSVPQIPGVHAYHFFISPGM